jgi:hypothetical protein
MKPTYIPNDAEKLLITALRSGEYRQGTGRLRRGDAFCCLGVACDLYAKATGLGKWEGERFATRGDTEFNTLPPEVQDWLGWCNRLGATNGNTLSILNDNGAPFSTIADIIERGEVLRAGQNGPARRTF